MQYKQLWSILAFLVILGSCTTVPSTPTPTSAPTVVSATTRTLVLGDIGDDPAERIKEFQPLADYLSLNLVEFGIAEVGIKIAPDFDTMIAWMRSGQVDLYFDSPYPTYILAKQSGARPILRRWRNGVGEYHTVIFSLKAGGPATLDALRGKLVAYDAPFSTSGFFLPTAYLINKGLTPVEKLNDQAAIAPDEVGYVFTFDDDNIIQWVISGKAAAGAVNSVNFAEMPEETKAAVQILAETESVPRHIVLARAGIADDLIAAIKALLIKLNGTDEGKEILKQFQKTNKFDEFPDGAEATFARMEALDFIITKRR
jgi:phosphonate transport system substrate-binding protein